MGVELAISEGFVTKGVWILLRVGGNYHNNVYHKTNKHINWLFLVFLSRRKLEVVIITGRGCKNGFYDDNFEAIWIFCGYVNVI